MANHFPASATFAPDRPASIARSIWITGGALSGKTQTLVDWFQGLRDQLPPGSRVLALAASSETRWALMERLAAVGWPAIDCTTPLGFFEQEVMLFYPLLAERAGFVPQFPLLLRPENEQELAGQLWGQALDENPDSPIAQLLRERAVRRLLDLLQLAANSGTDLAEIPDRLVQGLGPAAAVELPGNWVDRAGALIVEWRDWCLRRGLLTYGLVSWLYGNFLLSDPRYLDRLQRRYQVVLADDTDDFPALAGRLLTLLQEGGAWAGYTHNRDGASRLGLGADPAALQPLADRCTDHLDLGRANHDLVQRVAPLLTTVAREPFAIAPWAEAWPPTVQVLTTIARAQLLRETAETIVQAVQTETLQPQDIAVISPGLDSIAGYTLATILRDRGLPVTLLGNQRPLISSPTVRSLLTLWTLVYSGLGDWLNREDVAEMLVGLSTEPDPWLAAPEPAVTGAGSIRPAAELDLALPDLAETSPTGLRRAIDPVRAGLIADHCFRPDRQRPELLPVEVFARWDRLGYRATMAYQKLRSWISEQQQQLRQRLIRSPLIVLDRAVQQFLWHGGRLDPAELAALRELLEAAHRYWDISHRIDPQAPETETIHKFIALLRRGTIAANPFPSQVLNPAPSGITLANIFQYRTARLSHRWHFWLDASSPLWPRGGAAVLFGSPLFLQDWNGRRRTPDDEEQADLDRFDRVVHDLLGRCRDQLYLCHSDLSVTGQDQLGPMRPVIDASELGVGN
ncbi:recombinase family protein [Limnothrix redekei]|uniref:Recombinase family protein n=1 Tax=Limnothrix redekei LRLZ20PSL1 TaxID=3112953 RepID=A0ABW7CEV0_9CYAN